MAGHLSVSIIPIALGFGAGGIGEVDWYDIKQPDGRVLSTGDGTPRYFKDTKDWAKSVKRSAAVWR